jgi:ribosomal protein L7/L12
MSNSIEELQLRVADGMSQFEAIDEMKRFELSIIEAIKLTRELYCIRLGEAKNAISSHPAYAQVAEASRPWQDEIIRVFQELENVNLDFE